MKYILASASPRRKELLSRAGFPFEVIPSEVEEILTGNSPAEIVTLWQLRRQRTSLTGFHLKIFWSSAPTPLSYIGMKFSESPPETRKPLICSRCCLIEPIRSIPASLFSGAEKVRFPTNPLRNARTSPSILSAKRI